MFDSPIFVLQESIIFRALQALRQCLPDQLRDETFTRVLADDKSTRHWLKQLLKNIGKFIGFFKILLRATCCLNCFIIQSLREYRMLFSGFSVSP